MSHDPIKVRDTKAWFSKARNDLAAARVLIAQGLVDEVAFHCQQSVEKSLKGYLYWNNMPFNKTHDLSILATGCDSIDSSLAVELSKSATLTQYAVEYRYPGPLSHPTEAEAQELIDLSSSIFELILSKLPAEVVLL